MLTTEQRGNILDEARGILAAISIDDTYQMHDELKRLRDNTRILEEAMTKLVTAAHNLLGTMRERKLGEEENAEADGKLFLDLHVSLERFEAIKKYGVRPAPKQVG